MKLRVVCLLTVLLCCAAGGRAQTGAVSFNLSTSKSFAPGEQPKIHLYTHNVDALEFRVYRVNDPVKFMENLRELHSFGPEAEMLGKERIDERTWLERFHDWKHELWISIRDFFRYQFSWEARQDLRARVSGKPKPGVASFAQVPLINARQLVARWHVSIATRQWDETVKLPLDKPESGVYAIEATDGVAKAYTIVILSHAARVVKSAVARRSARTPACAPHSTKASPTCTTAPRNSGTG